jgi:hypothetical protein
MKILINATPTRLGRIILAIENFLPALASEDGGCRPATLRLFEELV